MILVNSQLEEEKGAAVKFMIPSGTYTFSQLSKAI